MAQFPIDIVADILSRLPVEPILRFRCVSKPWCALIDSPHFVKLHLKRSVDIKSNRQLVLSDGRRIYSVGMTMGSSLDAAVKHDLPPLKKNRTNEECYPSVLASCNGLVLLLLYPENNFVIWNPSTKKCQNLPISTSPVLFEPSPVNEIDYCGIGYDSVHDDYKVMKIVQFFIGDDRVTLHTEVQVYSLKMNSWRILITDFPYHLSVEAPRLGMLVSGALHWVASETDDRHDDDADCFIVAFDLATEEYRIVPMPCLDHKESVGLHLEVASLEGSLCVLCKYLVEPFNVWVMKDYGVKESWTKLLSIPQQSDIAPFDFPVAFSTDGTKLLLLQDGSNPLWYDLKHMVLQTVNIHGLRDVRGATFCAQSLVPLGNGMEQHKEESKDKKRKRLDSRVMDENDQQRERCRFPPLALKRKL